MAQALDTMSAVHIHLLLLPLAVDASALHLDMFGHAHTDTHTQTRTNRHTHTHTHTHTHRHAHTHTRTRKRGSPRMCFLEPCLAATRAIRGVFHECNPQLTIGIPGFRFAADRHTVAARASVRSLDLALKIPGTFSPWSHLYMCGPSVDEQIPESTIVARCVLECPVAVEVGPPLTASLS